MTSEIEKTTISAFENAKNLTEGKKERKKIKGSLLCFVTNSNLSGCCCLLQLS